jgi:biopolymer transport protein ExbD
MRSAHTRPLVALSVAFFQISCGGEKKEEKAAPAAPIVSVLELPITLRTQAAAPAGAPLLEVGSSGINLANQPVLTLNGGTLQASDRQGEQLPKLVQALSAASHAKLAVAIASTIPYDTVLAVIASAKAAGAGELSFQVRAPSGTTPGYLALDNIDLHAKTKSEEPDLPSGATARPWSDFVTQWDAVANGCRAAKTGSCAFKPEKIADGGELKIVLHAAGQGVNVEFFRIGPPPEVAPAAEPEIKGKKGKAAVKKKGKKKVEMIDGVPAAKDVVDEAENAPPASEALFQFRAQEAVTAPSPVTDTIKPVCGGSACAVVVQAEKATSFVRVISLIGAAFPDGSPAPRVVFESP